MLLPSKVIKNEFEAEIVQTKNGQTLVGLVRPEGDTLVILSAEKTIRVPKADVESRAVKKVSVMPKGLADGLSRREFEDLVLCLSTLK